jgi:hypothetical protein
MRGGYVQKGGKQSAAAQRSDERRLREDEAPRLVAEVPDLLTLSLTIEDCSSTSFSRPRHVRHVVIASAPALFAIVCSDSNCREGGHDVTRPVMQALAQRETVFDGEDACQGCLGSSICTRVLHYDAVATYKIA